MYIKYMTVSSLTSIDINIFLGFPLVRYNIYNTTGVKDLLSVAYEIHKWAEKPLKVFSVEQFN